AARERVSFGAALRMIADAGPDAGASVAPGLSTRAAKAIGDFVALLDELRQLAETSGPEEVLEAALQRSGYLSGLEESLDPQDAGRLEDVQELVSVARGYTGRAEMAVEEETGSAPTLADFLEQVALVADADEVPDADPEQSGVVT